MARRVGTNGTPTLQIATHNGGVYPDVKLSILSNGNVGIRSTSPQYPLDVVGTINTTTGYKINGVDLDTDDIGEGINKYYTFPTTTGVLNQLITYGGTGSAKFLRFRLGGSPTGTAGICLSHQEVDNYFIYAYGNHLKIRHTDTLTSVLDGVQPDGAVSHKDVLILDETTIDIKVPVDIEGNVNISTGNNYMINNVALDTDDIGEGSTNLYSQFLTTTNGIDYNGNVGIKTAAHATYALNVNGSVNSTSQFLINGYPEFADIDGINNLYINSEKGLQIGYSSISAGYKLHVQGAAYIHTDCDIEGNLGIKNSNPTYDLDVVGDINYTGSMSENGVKLWSIINGDLAYPSNIGTTCVIGKAVINTVASANFSHIDCTSTSKFALQQTSAGFTTLQCASGQYIDFAVNNATKMTLKGSNGYFGIGVLEPAYMLDVNGIINTTNIVNSAKNNDNASFFGRSAVGYCGHADSASFSHIDYNNVNDYSILQLSSGQTIINSKSGTETLFRIGNAATMVVNATGLAIGTASAPLYRLDIPPKADGQAGACRIDNCYIGRMNNTNLSYTAFGHNSLLNNGYNYAILQNNGGGTYVNAASGQTISIRINNSEKLHISSGGFLGIGKTPNVALDVNGDISSTSTIYTEMLNIRQWDIYEKLADSGAISDGDLVFNHSGGTTDQGLMWLQWDDAGADSLDFTGSHRSVAENKDLYSSNYVGYIVSSTGNYKDLHSKYKGNKQNIKINSALPYVELTSNSYCPRVYGVVSDKEDETNTGRNYAVGGFNSGYKKDKGDHRLVLNAIGEGAIFVSDYNGIINNGDYVCSSPIPGIVMKQDDDILHNYTVAKITMDCDFNPQLEEVMICKDEIQYSSNIELGTSNISYTSNYDTSNVYTSNYDTSNVYTSNYNTPNVYTSNYDIQTSNLSITSNLVNILDENGDLIYINKLDENSSNVYDYEYEIRYIKLNGDIITESEYTSNDYRIAFLGCTDHCA
ncbi:hypothetical protein T484DRAFT_1757649 [Baffinella frigidus]|nr:hypothetical protein T484DRAFT_1757649 [Cryptophyta sp. CCMP2293]